MIGKLSPKVRESNSLHNWLFNSPIGYSFLAYHQFAILIRLWPIFRLWENIIIRLLTVLWSDHFVSADMTEKTLCHITQIKAQKSRIAILHFCLISFFELKLQIWVRQIFCSRELVCRWNSITAGGATLHPEYRFPLISPNSLEPSSSYIFLIIPLI